MKQGICIQGPTTYYKEVSDCWNQVSDIPKIWSTWVDEPRENIAYIRSKNIQVVESELPIFPGDLNINYQAYSTYKGIWMLRHIMGNPNTSDNFILKIRSDHTISDPKLFMEQLSKHKSYVSYLATSDIKRGKEYLYPADNLIYGEAIIMEEGFDFQTSEYYGIAPEWIIAQNFLFNHNRTYDVELTYGELIKSGASFFLKDCIENNIKIHWLKRNLEMVNFYNNEFFRF